MLNTPKLETAGSALGFVVAILSCKCLLAISYSTDANETNRLGWHSGTFRECDDAVQHPRISHAYGEVDYALRWRKRASWGDVWRFGEPKQQNYHAELARSCRFPSIHRVYCEDPHPSHSI
jgi:hypothetical protein